MKVNRKIFFVLLLVSSFAFANDDLKTVSAFMQNQSISFTENKGQVIDQNGNLVPSVLYKASSTGLDIYITESGITYIFLEGKEEEGSTNSPQDQAKEEKIEYKWNRTDLIFKNASIKKENVVAEDQEIKYSNYYTPNFPKGLLNVRSFKKITINQIYPGIDWVIYSNGKGLKYDLLVHPNADPSLIKMKYEGAGKLKLNSSQEISIETKLGTIAEGELASFEKETNKKINSAYIVNKKEVAISIGEYDKTKTLVIDPPLVWSTFCGGTMLDGPRGVDVDNSGNFIAAGYTASTTFFTVNPGGGAYYQGVSGGNTDVAILKFDNNGVLLWSTYYGGSSSEWAWDVDADVTGNILVTGRSHSANFPLTNPGGGAFFQNTLSGGQDAFIIKFNSAGVCFWATLYGGTSVDEAFGIASDANGNFALVGCTQSTNYLAAGLILNPGGGAYYQPAKDLIYDLFLIKFDPNCVMLWGTYYGGNSQDFFPVNAGGTSQDLVFDAAGNLFVTGQTLSTNFPTANPGGGAYFQGALAGNFDAFILKFTPTCVLNWGTYYGGASGDDVGFDTKVSSTGDLYVTGQTASNNFPTMNPGGGAFFQATNGGGFNDAFILRFDNLGVRKWSTYYGGSGNDIGFGSRLDACDNYYVVGETSSGNLSTVNPGGGSFFDGSYNGAGGYGIGDMFILKFDVTNVCTWATYLGGNNDEWGEDIAIDAQANVFVGGEYVTGSSVATLNPGGGAYYQATGNGNDDGAYLKFSAPTVLTAITTQTNVLCFGGSSGTATVNPSGGTAPYTYSWAPSGQTTQTATGLPAGTYTVFVRDANCNQLTSQITVTITQPTAIAASTTNSPATCGNNNGTATVTASGGTGTLIYSWAPSGGSNANATGLAAGIYTVYITDANGCTQTSIATILSSGGPTVTIQSQTNVTCNGALTGDATLNVTGGNSPYTYAWSPSGGTNANATGLGAGIYTCIVTDNSGCSSIQIVTITEPTALAAAFARVNICCHGACNGSATINVSGGTPGYNYSWSPTGQTNQTASMLCAGNYTCYIIDGNGCQQNFSVTITQPAIFTASANATNASFCPGNCTNLNASATGGYAPYTYSWAPGGMTNDTVNVCPTATTTYTCFATDSGGCCISNVQVTVTITGINVTTTATVSNCNSNTGTATANATNGTSPYTYLWSLGQTTQTATGLAPGTYSVIITDANGCTGTQTVTINLPPAITVVITTTPSACSTATGTATAIASNGTGPYSYNWSNGQNWPIATGLSAGFYFVVVTDANGCTQIQPVNVGNLPGPTATASATALASGSQLNATGGGTYLWSPPSGLSCTNCQNPIATPGQTTTYCVLVTDANGCTDVACVTITIDQCGTQQLSTLLPNAFTPNGDAVNDNFCVPANNCIKTFLLKVYDRWGEKVFETNDMSKCWDGIYKGEQLNTDVFAFYFDAVLTDGTGFSQKGNISLIR